MRHWKCREYQIWVLEGDRRVEYSTFATELQALEVLNWLQENQPELGAVLG